MSYIEHKSEESLEDYLEVILILSQKSSFVRSIDIAAELDYSKPSVSVAMKKLKGRDYIAVSEDGHLLTDWLVHLGVDPQVAAIDACKMEHDISPESYEAMKKCILTLLNRQE